MTQVDLLYPTEKAVGKLRAVSCIPVIFSRVVDGRAVVDGKVFVEPNVGVKPLLEQQWRLGTGRAECSLTETPLPGVNPWSAQIIQPRLMS